MPGSIDLVDDKRKHGLRHSGAPTWDESCRSKAMRACSVGAWDTHDVDAFSAMFADDFLCTDDTVR
jgi:hypothetical protein